MTQTALTAVTEVDTTLTALAAYIAAHPTAGVAVYSESGFATPTNANEVAASTFDTNAALLSHYEGLTAVQNAITGSSDSGLVANMAANTNVISSVQATNHVFPTTPSRKVKVRNGTSIFNNTDGALSHFVANVAKDTILYVDAVIVKTSIQLWYKILDGTYINDYVKVDDVDAMLQGII